MKALASVEAHNAFAATIEVTGCKPPRWRRVFVKDWRLGGRWVALGSNPDEVYLTMPEEDRLQFVRIGGHRVVEVDVSAAHLTILHGLLGLSLPAGDLYAEVPGVPRKVVKRWTTVTLGRGEARPRWAQTSKAMERAYDPKVICAAMVFRFPFLEDLLPIIPDELRRRYGDVHEQMVEARRSGFVDIGLLSAYRSDGLRLVPLYLQHIEATALTHAMAYLRGLGILSLPTHDGLIVAETAEAQAMHAMRLGFRQVVQITPNLDVARPPKVLEAIGADDEDASGQAVEVALK